MRVRYLANAGVLALATLLSRVNVVVRQVLVLRRYRQSWEGNRPFNRLLSARAPPGGSFLVATFVALVVSEALL